ncbi:MAG: DNA-binding protein Alba [archaeon]
MAQGGGAADEQPGRATHSHDRDNSGTIFIGNRPPMNYVMAAITQFHNGNTEITLKARGRAISVAVDVAEIVRNRFLPDIKVLGIKIGTESVENEKKEKFNVSSIEIGLGR